MPSPFPGMDPYLEDPEFWPDFHASLITYIRESLQARLPAPYFATSESRTWMEISGRYVEPDVNVLLASGREPRTKPPAGGTAVLDDIRTKPVNVLVPADEHHEVFLNIFARRDGGSRVVTTIELLSPTNKTPGKVGRAEYIRKQREVLDGQVNLVEIDLLRGGTHTTAVPYSAAADEAGPFDYHACVHQFDLPENYFVYAFRMEEKLPELAVPLLPGDGGVKLDLQAVFDRCWDTGPYRRGVDYSERPPAAPMRPEQLKWIRGVLAEKGFAPHWAPA